MVYLWAGSPEAMHDTEPDTFEPKTIPEAYSEMLGGIGVAAEAMEAGADDVERGDYYSRYFSQSPRMITNRGCVGISGSNIDLVQIIQKG